MAETLRSVARDLDRGAALIENQVYLLVTFFVFVIDLKHHFIL
jgi:hypothetical protein